MKIIKDIKKCADKYIVRKYARKDLFSAMGMSASQGRLLFITARISNNEFEQQCVAYSKQRLADDSQEANDQYLDAMQATQYQILTGYNGDNANYEPVTYNQLTSLNAVATNKQYIVSDNKGQILVTEKIARAFDEKYLSKGGSGHTNSDFNTFLKNIDPTLTQISETDITEEDVHNAWDKYFVSVNRGDTQGIYYDSELQSRHILGFTYHDQNKNIDPAYVTYNSYSFTGAGSNQIFLQENGDKTLFYRNFEVEVESYVDDYGEVQYLAKYKRSENLNGENLMQDDEYIYLENVKVEGTPDNFTYYKLDSKGEKIKGTDGEYLAYAKDSNGKIYVDQDFAKNNHNQTNPLIVDITSKAEDDFTKNEGMFSKYVGSFQTQDRAIFYEGSTAEQRELYDYAMAITEKYAKGSKLTYDADKVQYYKNIYQQMITKGFTTYNKMIDEKYISTLPYLNDGTTKSIDDETVAYRNDSWMVTMLKNGKLSLSYYDITNSQFIKTTLDDDESIVEKENKSKMAIAEQVYKNHMDKIESEDKKFDMELSKLESEHSALTTEYDSVVKVISKNVEKSFNVFNA